MSYAISPSQRFNNRLETFARYVAETHGADVALAAAKTIRDGCRTLETFPGRNRAILFEGMMHHVHIINGKYHVLYTVHEHEVRLHTLVFPSER